MYSRKETVVPVIQEILNLVCIAILYSIISLMSCFGIIFLIFLKYVKTTYSLAKQTRLKLEKEEVQLISLSDKITKCSESLERIPGIINQTSNHRNAPLQNAPRQNENISNHILSRVMNSAPIRANPSANCVGGTIQPLCISNKNIETLICLNNKQY